MRAGSPEAGGPPARVERGAPQNASRRLKGRATSARCAPRRRAGTSAPGDCGRRSCSDSARFRGRARTRGGSEVPSRRGLGQRCRSGRRRGLDAPDATRPIHRDPVPVALAAVRSQPAAELRARHVLVAIGPRRRELELAFGRGSDQPLRLLPGRVRRDSRVAHQPTHGDDGKRVGLGRFEQQVTHGELPRWWWRPTQPPGLRGRPGPRARQATRRGRFGSRA